ncbi:hypothetical protein GR927_36005 [Mycolicibacterium sp. 3033]|nr:hypothetical protein [Mycolicibacterium aurantiacum]
MKTLLVCAVSAAAIAGSPAAVAESLWFTSPSGNIACMIDGDLLRCDIQERDWSPPPRPADCPDMTGYGQGISLRPTGSASFVCAGDTTFGGGTVLPYGQFQAGGGMSCRSEPSGMRCSNTDGHGFTLSRQAYTLF